MRTMKGRVKLVKREGQNSKKKKKKGGKNILQRNGDISRDREKTTRGIESVGPTCQFKESGFLSIGPVKVHGGPLTIACFVIVPSTLLFFLKIVLINLLAIVLIKKNFELSFF